MKQDDWYLSCHSEPFEPKVRRDLSLLLNPGGVFKIESEYTSHNLICDKYLQTNFSECKKPPSSCKKRYTVCHSGEKAISMLMTDVGDNFDVREALEMLIAKYNLLTINESLFYLMRKVTNKMILPPTPKNTVTCHHHKPQPYIPILI